MARGHMVPGKGMIRGKPNPRHQTIGQRLKLAREAADMKPAPLSLAAGLSIDTCLRIEDQGRVPGVDVVERIARVLRISPGWLAYAPSRAEPAPLPSIAEGAPLCCAAMGERLRGLREERGLSRSALGKLTETTDTTIRLTEEGHTMPSVATVEQIARGLGVSAAWLAYGEGPQVLPRAPRHRKAKGSP